MNIVFLTRYNPNDINTWSGTLYHLYNKLKDKHTIKIIGTEILGQLDSFVKGNFSVSAFIHGDGYAYGLGRLLSERINALDYDLIFFGDIFFIPLDINIPFVLLSDLTFEQANIHINQSDNRNIEPCIRLEKLILNSSFRIIYCSEWIKRRVVDIYGIGPGKIEVVEFGANIPTPTNYSIEINTDICRLVFIGKKWEK